MRASIRLLLSSHPVVAAPAVSFFEDNFTGASGNLTDHTSDSGHDWIANPQTPELCTRIALTVRSHRWPRSFKMRARRRDRP